MRLILDSMHSDFLEYVKIKTPFNHDLGTLKKTRGWT